VNVELSAQELKNVLKAINVEFSKVKGYVKRMESELGIWRSGGSVPVDR
jgi:hypothetical protein